MIRCSDDGETTKSPAVGPPLTAHTQPTSQGAVQPQQPQNVNAVTVRPAGGGQQQHIVTTQGTASVVASTAQPAVYTVGTSSNLVRILASTQGYVQVRYGTPVTAVASACGAPSSSSPAVMGTPRISAPAPPRTPGGVAQMTSPSTSVTWVRATTPTSGSATTPTSGGAAPRVVPQRLSFQQDMVAAGGLGGQGVGGGAAVPRRPTTVASSFVPQQHVPAPVILSPSPTALASPANRHKKVKVEDYQQLTAATAAAVEVADLRRAVVEYRSVGVAALKESYRDHMSELFFLQNGLNIMDFLMWKKRANPQLTSYLRANALDSDDEEPTQPVLSLLSSGSSAGPTLSGGGGGTVADSPLNRVLTAIGGGGLPVTASTCLPAASHLAQHGRSAVTPSSTPVTSSHVPCGPSAAVAAVPTAKENALTRVGGEMNAVVSTVSTCSASMTTTTTVPLSSSSSSSSASVPPPPRTSPASSPSKAQRSLPIVSAASPARLQTRQHSISAVYDSTIGSQEEIVERAKQEAYVMQKIAELRKEGLWSERRLPKVQEPPRTKAHWDYLLEEMVWLATDFAQERKWKKATAKKCVRMCQKFKIEEKLRAERAEKDAELKLKRIASAVAKEIKQFWANAEKFVEFKQQSRLEEKRKRALDLQLSFIVDQTEKYSSWLAQGMNKSVAETSGQTSGVSSSQLSRSSSPGRTSDSESDDDFRPASDCSDDEDTIAKEEAIGVDEEAQQTELDLLRKESEAPLEDILRDLPPEILERPASPLVSVSEDGDEDDVEADDDEEEGSDVPLSVESRRWAADARKQRTAVAAAGSAGDDAEFVASDDGASSLDAESTLAEQEAVERNVDHGQELSDLRAEGEMSLEELADKYCGAYDSDFEMESVASETSEVSSSESDLDEESDVDVSGTDDDGSTSDGTIDIGLESLVDPISIDKGSSSSVASTGPTREITDIAAAAESFKPKGYTYLTTKVATKVPFLLKHQLREYQHIGLDWLVTMYERKLNGILADEMGLGKTIQTIALLAHLACEKGNWGPHLIVVPTSVMLNWEMELKKWCPAFKILTYYGSQKERKQKRQGWTKPNTFHVCITSYKLVIQDHQSFRRKKWKYFILDEAQNIKNFKSQRWQLLLNFKSQRRLLLTGTPLQNNLMELWSLMHFLMPNVFHSHRDFKEWFANPVSGMIEGSHDYNKELISRLHKVLRPFLLRRLKSEVEKQLPCKFEHVVMCRLSKRQRFLYDDFMSQAKTKETLASGSFMSVINVLMQLRKVCNHPNLFESRPTVSPFRMEGICYRAPSVCYNALDYDPFRNVDLFSLNLLLADLELCLTAFAAHRIKKFQTPRRLIEEIDGEQDPPPRCPAGKIKLHVRTTSSSTNAQKVVPPQPPAAAPGVIRPLASTPTTATSVVSNAAGTQQRPVPTNPVAAPSTSEAASQSSSGLSVVAVPAAPPRTSSTSVVQMPTMMAAAAAAPHHRAGYTLQLVQQPQAVGQPGSTVPPPPPTSTPITVQIQHTQQGPKLTVPGSQLAQLPGGFAQIVQTSTGQHILLTSNPQPTSGVQSSAVGQLSMASSGRLTVTLSSVQNQQVSSQQGPLCGHVVTLQAANVTSSAAASSSSATSTVTMPVTSKPVLRVPPMNTAAAAAVASSPVVNKPVAVESVPKMITRSNSCLEGRDALSPLRSQSRSSVKSIFHLDEVVERMRQYRRERLERLAKFNTRRCESCPIYGSDLMKAVTVVEDTDPISVAWRGMGHVHCLNATNRRRSSHPRHYWNWTEPLTCIVRTPEELLDQLSETLARFVFVVPPVVAPSLTFHVSHPSPSRLLEERSKAVWLRSALSPLMSCLHPIASAMATQFPDPRLIQYDCGKLQTLDKLLRRLKCESRRVLIFTQMTRMLDVLEQFLNYHGHIYLRLDGTTRVDQRQALMERFNADRRIFCFILSTRSGGIGVNLTGADTVIFYDSDWNPTMDAQAQDRCHRIGQTRDVHIFRLISDRTVEENILKKANQKRLLGEVAIEGGNFTTAFFKKHTIQELFEMDFDNPRKDFLAPPPVVKQEPKEEENVVAAAEGAVSITQFEHALANAEEDTDVQAAKTAKAEAAAELAEFDESIPYDCDSRGDDDSKVEDELGSLMSQLTPIERYAMTFLELNQEEFSLEQLKQAEDEIEAQKKDWELGRLQALKEEEERQALLEDNDIPYTYSREDAYNQIFVSQNTGEQMPVWTPPTPPQDESDVYVDYSMCFLYEPNVMPESQLPPVYVKKEHKRARSDAAAVVRKQKMMRKDDNTVFIPRSLFDRPTAATLKMRRDFKTQKSRGALKSVSGYKPPAVINKPIVDTHQDSPEWLIHEDWALLQAMQCLLELPLNLMVLSPAHTPNWDLVADVVNATSRMYRSGKQCKSRYESVIIPREEGKILYDTNPKKQKKSKGIYRTKNNRPMRTSQLFVQDNNMSFTHLCHQHFETIKSISNKRMPTLKPMLVNTSIRNPKHAAVLAETGINSDQPLTPVQVATNRADRITREKLKSQVLSSEQLVVQQRQTQVQPVSSLIQPTTPVQSPSSQAVIGLSPGSITPQQLQSVIGRMGLATPQMSNAATPAGVHGAVRSQRTAANALVMQDMVGGVAQVRNVGSAVPQAVVSMGSLVASQVTTAAVAGTPQRVGVAAGMAGVSPGQTVDQIGSQQAATAAKGLTAAQIQLLRTQSLYKQQQQQQQRLQQVAQQQQQVQQQQIALQSPKVSMTVTSLLNSGVATVQVGQAVQPQQQQQQRFQAVKQGVPRAMTEAEVAQLFKRQYQLHQQKAAAAAAAASQVTQVQVPPQGQLTPQILAQAQLQQFQQQQQVTSAGGQAQLATLVKTVSTPSPLSGSQSVTIPVGGMAGVNISLPQVKATVSSAKGSLVAQQPLQQVKLQQHIQQQRKLQQQQQQKVVQQFSQGKTQLNAIQIVPQTAAVAQGTSHKALPSGVTVQQLQQVVRQVQPQTIQHLTQGSGAATAIITQAAVIGQSQVQQAMSSHSVLTKTVQSTPGGATSGQATVHARLVPMGQAMTGLAATTLAQQQQAATGVRQQTVQVVQAATASQMVSTQIRAQAVGADSAAFAGRVQAPVAMTVATMTLPPGTKGSGMHASNMAGLSQVINSGNQSQHPPGSGR